MLYATEDDSAEQGIEEADVIQEETDASQPSDGGQRQQRTMEVDDAGIHTAYANFCRVSSTPEEFILDVGLNVNPIVPSQAAVKLSHRIIMNHFTAKRLLGALSMTLQQHEQSFGVLETDVRKRVRQVD